MKPKILFLCPEFNPLKQQIADELDKLGYDVKWVEDKSYKFNPRNKTTPFKLLANIIQFIRTICNFKSPEIKEILNDNWDFFLCINGYSLDRRFIKTLNKNNKKIKKILYLWDSTNFYSFEKFFKYFDSIYTFDYEDSKKFKINYLPLFWIPTSKCNNEIFYDLSFIGKLHSDRYEVLKKIKELCLISNYSFYIKLFIQKKKNNLLNKIIFKIKKIRNNKISLSVKTEEAFLTNKLKDEILTDTYINNADVQDIISKSKCIIDVEIPNQTGLTIRCIQSLSQGKKIITTNTNIQNDPYFKNNSNILIINRENPTVDKHFIESEFQYNEAFNLFFNNLRIDNWINKLLDLK